MTAELVIKVSIADDHKIFRDGIKMALKNKEYLRILWEAEDGKDLVHKMQIKRPDVLLMDIRMPEVDGINAIGLLRKEYEDVKIIVLTMYDERTTLSKQVAEDLRSFFGAQVFNTVIPRNVRLAEAPSHGKPIMLYDIHSRGAEAYVQLAKEVVDNEQKRLGARAGSINS